MSYGRVTPRARIGTTGVSEEMDVGAGEGVWINPPDRVAAITVAVHIQQEQVRLSQLKHHATDRKQSARTARAVIGITRSARAQYCMKTPL